ncbi:GNAT family N-acetyltransferase [Corallococcus sp. ZKHCc1 1396]|uniref:GNAT family N-acetyltransferase n=1 Tax=Corallococcus soli TaxID=2710757 RepID=A0ABR9PMQ2_9BACT|nr:GNAT family protein [Corallococcus soli]MBE4749195.1 GNAT family N-acetyltransferase [Corallococcus soli]
MTTSSSPLSSPEAPEPYRLRLITRDDADEMVAMYGEPETARSLNLEVPLRPEIIREKLAVDLEAMRRGEAIRWVLFSREDEKPLGFLSLFNWNVKARRAEVGYMVARKVWGQGVMKTLLPVMVRFGFEQMGLHRMEALVSVRNPASLRVLTRAGFRQEGVLRSYQPTPGGGFVDMHMLSLLEDEWRAALAT